MFSDSHTMVFRIQNVAHTTHGTAMHTSVHCQCAICWR